ncbi:VOC family protein [Dactylosporangium roseum]|uniref:VOC family protein n=1 Tax=Dactylosporangium roseum TaxID=47989 RepID=A0ABY5Z2L6_9ACTN|nr:VOC family protein [Dactylosporangium roseum]UWZ35722.1 VOC family protein [Dactylosporangium roseum]
MPSSNRAPSSGGRRLAIGLLIVVGGFLAFCGLGMAEPLVVALGIVLAAVGPVLIAVLNSRNKVRQYVYGQATVDDISPRPTLEGRTARGRIRLTIRATGINGVTVSIHDPAVPLTKWPEPGATLPVRVVKGNPRKVTIQWDRVQTHREAMEAELDEPVGGMATGAEHYPLAGDEYGSDPLDLPPDDRPTLTDLPPITAPIAEPARRPGGRMTAVAERTSTLRAAPAPRSEPDLDARPVAESQPEPVTGLPAGAAPEHETGLLVDAPAEKGGDSPNGPIETRAALGGVGAPASDEPAAGRLPSKPVSGGPHRRPSPRPHRRPGSPDRSRRPAKEEPDSLDLIGTVAAPEQYTIPEGGSLLAAPPRSPEPGTLPPDPPPETPATGSATTTVDTGPAPTETPPDDVPPAATDSATTAAVSGETGPVPAEAVPDRGPDTSAETVPPAVISYPDRETEQPPTRVPRLDRSAFLTDESTAETDTGQAGKAAGETPAEATHVTPVETLEGTILDAPRDDTDDTDAADTTDEAAPDEQPPAASGTDRPVSAWSNGRGPVGAGLYSAPLIWPAPSRRGPADHDEAATPDPYATEHYLPEDQLEEQPLSEGAVAEFLATAPRPQSMPLNGVNGVSVTLIVSDLRRSRRFYRDTLGLTELDSGPTSAVLATGDARVVLRRVADMPPVDRRVVHLNLEVPDVYEAYERLREQGVDFVHRPRVVPQGEQLELCSATFRDPDGHAIALTRWELRR